MIMALYEFPLPNNGERYDLSKEELVNLLDRAYHNGFDHARNIYDSSRQGVLTWTSSDDWKEIHLNVNKGE